MSRLEAIRLLTWTFADDPKSIPLGFVSTRVPLENRAPSIWLIFPPISRASKLEVFDGKVMSTVSFWPMLNELKLMMVPLAALMFRVLPVEVMVAEPDSTWAPCGRAKATEAQTRLKHKRMESRDRHEFPFPNIWTLVVILTQDEYTIVVFLIASIKNP